MSVSSIAFSGWPACKKTLAASDSVKASKGAAGLQGKFEIAEAGPTAASAAGPQAKSEKSEHVPSPALLPEFELKVAFETLMLASASDVADDCARQDALTIFKAMIVNDARLVPPQANLWRCVVCDEKEAPGAPLVPVLTPVEGEYRWLHLRCHDTYCRRQAERVDELLRAAGLLCQ